jgi:FAD/FMN-containing dehydrogenase
VCRFGFYALTLVNQLAAIVGPRHVAADVMCTDWRGLFSGRALAVVSPASTAEVAACVAACAAAGVPVVPLGGNTGLCGGATPRGGEVVIGLSRLNCVRALDPTDLVMVAEAGVTLEVARAAATAEGLALPVSLASGGTAQIGGLVATNAGGNSTLRYGNMREQVLGLEVVLADGQVWDGLRRLRKDNTGLALRQLFVGAEGTLGIITAACLRLVPAPAGREVALAAVPDAAAAVALLGRLRQADEAGLHAFEYLSGAALRMAVAEVPGCTDPFATAWPAYALVELAGPGGRALLQEGLAQAMADGVVQDAVIAASESQRAALWRLRESQTEAQTRAGANIKNDIAVPIARIPAFLDQATRACMGLVEGVRVVPFGHLGDGNIHFNLVAPESGDPGLFTAKAGVLMAAVSDVAHALEGSFSAEHGIGQAKIGLLAQWRGGVELDLMRRVKAALDPAGLFNPGKLFERGD